VPDNVSLRDRRHVLGTASALAGLLATARAAEFPILSRYALALIATIFIPVATFAADASRRPNFVFLFADDQRYDAMGVTQREQGEAGRFPWFTTPNMDRLAREGVRFRNAFVVNPLCSPSRACFLTGRYSHANGVYNNRTPLRATLPTYATLLRDAGYSTGYVGKWHMGMQPARPGFDWSASFIGQGAYTNAKFIVNGTPAVSAEWTDDRSAAYAVEFLENGRAKGKPFLLVVGFKAPHGPFTPPKRRANAFAGAVSRRVPNLGLPPGFNRDLGKRKEVGEKVPVNLNMFRCIAAVDDNLGKVLDALDRLKLAGNTVVVYGSDNGYYLGEHTLGDKRSAYDESLRIPLLVRDPRGGPRGVTRDDLVLNIDLAPTFLDLAGVPIPKEMRGKSWKPLLAKEAPKAPLRASFFFEYFRETGPKRAPKNAVGGYNTPTLTGVRTAAHKLLKYRDHPEWSELYDLAADPFETRNLYADPKLAGVRDGWEKEHDRLAKELGYAVPAGVPPEPKR
jgi:arylsulfatase A-like enzyme